MKIRIIIDLIRYLLSEQNRKYILTENKRIWFQLIVSILILLYQPALDFGQPNLLNLVLRKLALVSIGSVCAHWTYKNLFYYIDTKELLNSKDEISVIKYLGICIFRGFYYLAWILGLALGL